MSHSEYQVGELYLFAFYDDVDGKVKFTEHLLRSIRKESAYFVLKLDAVTWGKCSKRHGDYGWLKNIPEWARTKVEFGSEGLERYSQSKAKAIEAALKAVKLLYKRAGVIMGASGIAEIEAYERALARYLK